MGEGTEEGKKEWPKVIIPKDPSLYPGFPDTEGLPKEEADNAILLFWKMWRKEKAKKKKHAKRLEEKNAKREAKGLPPIEKEKEREALGLPPIEKMKDVEKEKDRQPYIPADIKTYANCP